MFSAYDSFGTHSEDPVGLQVLTDLDHLIFQQKVEILEMQLGGNIETPNKYSVKDSSGQEMFTAEERMENDAGEQFHMGWMCCGAARSFDIGVCDKQGNEVIRLYRKMKSLGELGCCRQADVEVSIPAAGAHDVVGYVVKVWQWTRSEFEVKDKSGQTVLIIKGPCCPLACGGDLDFRVMTADKVNEVGKITKKWAGIGNEFLTDAETFHLTFPKDLDVAVKATLIGAALLIDFAFFES